MVEPPKLDLDHVEEASGYQIRLNTELEGCRKIKLEEFEFGVQISGFLPKNNVFCKIILPAFLVMGRPKLELDHVEEASGNQMHVNIELESCRKVKLEEFELGLC